jgi:LysR family transcriptional regulator, glycine cleavage system transcriptional activator
LRAFEVAARHRSLAKAAEELAVTPAAIHHQVKSLEENLGVTLFTRSGNNLALTQAAAAVLPTLEGAFDLLSLVTEQLKQYTREGMLRIATCPAFGQKWLVPRLSRFKSDFPQIDLRISNIDRLPELSNTEIDIAVFYSHAPSVEQHEALIDLLLHDEVFPVCSPSYRVEHHLNNEEDLKLGQVIQDNQLMKERKIGWSDWFRSNVNPCTGDALQVDTTILAIESAIAGNGVVLAPSSLVQHDISVGRLVRLFKRSLASPGGYHVAHLNAVAEQPMVVAFREWLFAEVSVNRALLATRPTSAEALDRDVLPREVQAVV